MRSDPIRRQDSKCPINSDKPVESGGKLARGTLVSGTGLSETAHSRRYYVTLIGLVVLVVLVLGTAGYDWWTDYQEDQRKSAAADPTVAPTPLNRTLQ